MAPARLKCLNASRHLANLRSNVKAGFSTTSAAQRITSPARSSSVTDLLEALGEPAPGKSDPNPFENPIKRPERRPARPSGSTNERLLRLMNRTTERQENAQNQETGSTKRTGRVIEDLDSYRKSADMSKQITRRWRPGDVYAPHDLSATEMAKWKKFNRPVYDAFDVLNFNPMDHYKNFSVLSEYMTEMGRIRHSTDTGLRAVSQRRIARTIRRAVGMGMMPSVHRHPQILLPIAQQVSNRSSGRIKPM